MPDLHFTVEWVRAGVDAVVIGYRNQRGQSVSEVLQFDPDNGLAHAVLCYAHTTLGQQSLAEQECNRALRLMQASPFALAHDTRDVTAFMRQHELRNYTDIKP